MTAAGFAPNLGSGEEEYAARMGVDRFAPGDEREGGRTCEPTCHAFGIGCGCSTQRACTQRAYPNTAGHFCGQWQPHGAHTWQTPQVYGVATVISTYQCAGRSQP